ncbi:MAG: thioesterase family protein [Calditrichaeota bacterium]|nr:MAG: thioesterase family protein [Calditrichota bacterium]
MENSLLYSDEFYQAVAKILAESIPFNKLLGLQLVSLDEEGACIRFDMREELIGNFVQGILHGGVISTTLDMIGGLTAFLGVLQKNHPKPFEELLPVLTRIGTIDLRVDFLRPGKGEYFLATGKILRIGNKVAVTRMELHNDQNVLIAVGTGTYLVG